MKPKYLSFLSLSKISSTGKGVYLLLLDGDTSDDLIGDSERVSLNCLFGGAWGTSVVSIDEELALAKATEGTTGLDGDDATLIGVGLRDIM